MIDCPAPNPAESLTFYPCLSQWQMVDVNNTDNNTLNTHVMLTVLSLCDL